MVQNLNGSQQLIKTYTLSPDADPQKLIEDPFELNGFLYTFADIVKTENRAEDHKYHTKQVTVETETNSLPEIQKQFASTLEYDDGLYSGTLTFDATAILTEPSGYTNQSRTIKGTKTIGPVDRNDMSYVPATLTVLPTIRARFLFRIWNPACTPSRRRLPQPITSSTSMSIMWSPAVQFWFDQSHLV